MSGRIPEPGELLAERYRVIRLIGEGGMGAVLEGENQLTGKRVAVKLLHPSLDQNSEAAQRLLREAQASCRVRHQNVVDVYDVIQEDGALFLVMELLDGEPLGAVMERGGQPAHEFIHILVSAMRGVAAAHQAGVIHRDIHPGNIFLAREPPNKEPVTKVLDFGIAKVRDVRGSALTRSGTILGSPLYMSYEQLINARDIDARTDIYSFGVLLYQGLTGRAPYAALSFTELMLKVAGGALVPPKQLMPTIPGALDKLICWSLQRDRENRIQTMDAFIDELELFGSARAFRAQMTDAALTLPSLAVPLEGVELVVPEPVPSASEPTALSEPQSVSEPLPDAKNIEGPLPVSVDGIEHQPANPGAGAAGSAGKPAAKRVTRAVVLALALAVPVAAAATASLYIASSRSSGPPSLPRASAPPPIPSLPRRPPNSDQQRATEKPNSVEEQQLPFGVATPGCDPPLQDAGTCSTAARAAPAVRRRATDTRTESGRRIRAGAVRLDDF